MAVRRRPVDTVAKTLDVLRALGYFAERIERPWSPVSRRKHDPFGADVLAFRGSRTVLVQATTVDRGSEHRTALENTQPEVLHTWCCHGMRTFEVWTWDKRGGRGARKIWTYDRWSWEYSYGEHQWRWTKLGALS